MKVLVIRFSSIGDIVLTTPVVRILKTQLDEAEVHYATKVQFKNIVENNPYLDKVHYLETNLTTFINQLKAEKFDYIIDLHHNLRTLIIKLRLGVKSSSFNKLNFRKWLLVNLKINRLPKQHIVERYLEAAKKLDIKNDALGLDYFIPDQDEVPIDWLPATHQRGFVVYAMGAQHNTKKLPLEKMIELCAKIGRPIVLLGGEKEIERGEQIGTHFENKASRTIIYNACGKYNLNQSASILKRSQLVFTHDTGLMHVAAAFKKEVVSIWGNTMPDFGMTPYRTHFTVIENNKIHCRPCSKIGFDKCPKGHFKCMKDIVFDFVLYN
jgi:ADP-heptose:LPS heptosyltransferase